MPAAWRRKSGRPPWRAPRPTSERSWRRRRWPRCSPAPLSRSTRRRARGSTLRSGYRSGGNGLAAAAAFAASRRACRTGATLARGDGAPARGLRARGRRSFGGSGVRAGVTAPRMSLDAMRSIALLALLLPLGASRVAAKGRAWLIGVFLGASAINALVAVLESRGLFRPSRWRPSAGVRTRAPTPATSGTSRSPSPWRACSRSASYSRRAGRSSGSSPERPCRSPPRADRQPEPDGADGLLAGARVLLVLRFRARAALPLAAAVAAVAVAVAAYPPLASRAGELARAASIRNWDAVLSFRGGPWAAAIEMTRERP